MPENGKRYSFESSTGENKPFVVRQAPPVLGLELFDAPNKARGLSSEVLNSQFFIASRERMKTREREYAIVIEMPFSSLRLEQLMRSLAVEPEGNSRAINSKEVVERINNLGHAAVEYDDERWNAIGIHAQKFSDVMSSSGQTAFSSLESVCARREDIREDIIAGRFARTYRAIADNPPESMRKFLERLSVAIHDTAFIWSGKRVPPFSKTDRLFSRFAQIGPGAREAVVARVLDELSVDEVEGFISAHADVLNATKIVSEGGKTAYVRGGQGLRVAALSDGVATVVSQNSMSQISLRDGEHGVEFDIRTKELGSSLLIPAIIWSRDKYGFRYWDLGSEIGISSAGIPIRSNKDWVNHQAIISTSQYDSLLGLMVFDLLHADVKEWISKRFGSDRRFEHPGMSIMGTLQRKDVLLESEVLKRAERIVNVSGEEV